MSSEQRIDVACAVLVFDERNNVLLVKRRRDPHVPEALWCWPTGRLEFGETGAQAAARETLEETGVTIRILSPHPQHVSEYIEPVKEEHCVLLEYVGRYVSGEEQNMEPEKHDAVRWFSLASLPENLSFSTKTALEKVLKD